MPRKHDGFKVSRRMLRRAIRKVRRDQVRFERPRESKALSPCFRERERITNPVQTAYGWLLRKGHISIDGKTVALTEKGKELHVRLETKR